MSKAYAAFDRALDALAEAQDALDAEIASDPGNAPVLADARRAAHGAHGLMAEGDYRHLRRLAAIAEL